MKTDEFANSNQMSLPDKAKVNANEDPALIQNDYNNAHKAKYAIAVFYVNTNRRNPIIIGETNHPVKVGNTYRAGLDRTQKNPTPSMSLNPALRTRSNRNRNGHPKMYCNQSSISDQPNDHEPGNTK